jgi:hypothetical protein
MKLARIVFFSVKMSSGRIEIESGKRAFGRDLDGRFL